ncbi:MAG: heterodisulfide reductase-related iron-sulfur binding cluster [Dehalococcoidia bacterium]|nr:heterodisulfide reductase-related iron-sulfur binding cluster [Dehalococcoidia bacterium]
MFNSLINFMNGYWLSLLFTVTFLLLIFSGLFLGFGIEESTASREIFFNVSPWPIYLLLSIFTGILIFGILRHGSLWLIGKPVKDWNINIPWRLNNAFKLGVMQDKVRRDLYASVMHWCISASIIILTFVTAQVALEDDTPLHFLHGNYYLFFSFYGDLFGLIGLIGVSMAIYRRYFDDFHRIRWDERIEDHLILWGLFLILLSGFFVESYRISIDELSSNPEWARWSFVSYLFANFTKLFNFSEGLLLNLHTISWWTHVAIVFFWLTLVVFTKLDHFLFAPINAFLLRTDSPGRLSRIENIEEQEVFGVGQIQDFNWKQLFELDACVRCGRCTEVCPANLAGQPLSPMHLIQDLKAHFNETAPLVQEAGNNGEDVRTVAKKAMIGDVIKEETLWACRTCGACVQECPVMIEHVPSIIDMRRFLVMDEAKIPQTAQAALENLEMRGHPWKGTALERTTWMEGLGDVPIFDGSQEYLYWVGCSGSLVERNLPITKKVFSLLKAAGSSFGVLGQEETCNGDPARRLGNEYLYQILAEQLITTFKEKNVQKVITNCPHCFNTFKNEYPQFDGKFEVLHHTQFLDTAIQEGKLVPNKPIDIDVTYHDSCYLGRINNEYDAPRNVLNSIPGLNIIEMDRNKSKGLCCGAGGGNMWQEEVGARRVNHVRSEEAIDTGADELVSNCPFCIQMFEDGVPSVEPNEENRIKPFDIAEVLYESIDSLPEEN